MKRSELSNPGIYKIENLVNHKLYIGQAVNIYNRFNHHKRELRRNKHKNPHLQFAWNKYGEKNFIFEVLEFVGRDAKLLELRETYYFRQYPKEQLYNINDPSMGNLGRKFQPMSDTLKQKVSKRHRGKITTKETKKKMSEAQSKRSVLQIDINSGEVIREFDSITEASEETGIETIGSACKDKMKTAGGFIWCYKDSITDISIKIKRAREANNGGRLPVNQIDVNSNLIMETFYSLSDAERKTNISRKQIVRVCLGEKKVAGGFYWQFVTDGHLIPNFVQESNKTRKAVNKISVETGEVLATFDSILEASKEAGTSESTIISVCKGKGYTAGGFIWKYVNSEE